MSTITREQLHERAREKVKSLEFAVTQTAFADSRAELEEELELARIALASLEAKPVAWTDEEELRDANVAGIGYLFGIEKNANKFADPRRQIMLYRHAQPVPVVPPAIEPDYEVIKAILPTSNPDEYACCIAADMWNACRAVMLQAGNSPVIQDGWQLVPKEPTEAMNKAGWAAMNEHDAINPTYRAMLAAAPQQDVRLALEIGMSRYAGAMQKLVDSGD